MCLVFEDTENGVLAATRAGMAVALVNSAAFVPGVRISIPGFLGIRVKRLSGNISVEFDAL